MGIDTLTAGWIIADSTKDCCGINIVSAAPVIPDGSSAIRPKFASTAAGGSAKRLRFMVPCSEANEGNEY